MSEGIDVNKIVGPRESITSHCWYFLEINFNIQREVYNGCYNLVQKQKAISFNNFAISFC